MSEYIIDKMAEWVCGLRYEDIPDRVLKKAKLQILNILAAAFSGKHYGTLGSIRSINLPDGPSTVLSTGEKTTAEYASFINAIYSMSFDFDDYLFMAHPGHSSVLVALSMGEELNLTIKDIITAQVAVNEIEGRIGASVLLGPHNGQMWSYIHAIGAAASVSMLLGLTRRQIASAMAVSMYQPNYPLTPGFMISDSKLTTAAIPIITGMFGARLAKTGMHGNTAILETKGGFLEKFSYLPLKTMLSGFGEWWVTDSISFKPYPGCAYMDTTIDSIYKIMSECKQKTGKDLDANDIKHIYISAGILTIGMNKMAEMNDTGTLDPVNINFSIPKSAAITIINHGLLAKHLSSGMLSAHEQEINALSKKVVLSHDWTYTLKTIASFYDAVGGRFLFAGTGIYKLLKAFHLMRKNLPKIPLQSVRLLKARRALSGQERDTIVDGLKRKYDHVNMNAFTFSFGSRVNIELYNNSTYEAESKIPKGASNTDDQEEVVRNKLKHAVESEQKAKMLMDILKPDARVRAFVDGIV